jgi:hypothetical protein
MSEKPNKPPFTIVDSPPLTPIPPSRKLGPTGLTLWDRIQNEFRIDDVAGIELLMQACLAADRAQALGDIIDADGERVHTKQGLKAHPCLKDELAARSFVVRTLQRLGLVDEVIHPIGRPPRGG